MLRLTCKHCPFVHIGARLILLCIAFIQSGHAWSVRQEGPCFEQGIVHLIDDIFWNCGFKTESHGDQVIIVIIALYCALLLLLDLL